MILFAFSRCILVYVSLNILKNKVFYMVDKTRHTWIILRFVRIKYFYFESLF